MLFAMRSGERCQRSANAEVSGANRGRKLEVMVGTSKKNILGKPQSKQGGQRPVWWRAEARHGW
jgi:hypothetical protein